MLETVEIKAGRVDEEMEVLETMMAVRFAVVGVRRPRKVEMVVVIGGG